jgi:hypothetical protein
MFGHEFSRDMIYISGSPLAKKNVTSDILLVLITKPVINYTYYVNLYFANKIQILVKTGILEIIS